MIMLLQSLDLSEHPHFLTLASKWCILKGTKIKSCVMVYCVSKNLGTTLEISVLLCAFTCYPFILGGGELTHLTCHIYQGNTDQEH